MTATASALPLELDPLIAEAKRRMRRRRLLLATTLVVAVATIPLFPGFTSGPGRGSLAGGQAAHPVNTYRLGWTSRVVIHGHVALLARVDWLRTSSSHWSVSASVVNRSTHTLRPITTGKTAWALTEWTAAELAHPIQCNWSLCRGFPARSFRPALPRTLRPGERWTGVFSGRGRLSRHWLVNMSLGYYHGLTRSGFGLGSPGELSRSLQIP